MLWNSKDVQIEKPPKQPLPGKEQIILIGTNKNVFFLNIEPVRIKKNVSFIINTSCLLLEKS